MIRIDDEQRRTIKTAASLVRDQLNSIRGVVDSHVGTALPLREVTELDNQLGALLESLRPGEKVGAPVDIHASHVPAIRSVIQFGRRALGVTLDGQREKVVDPALTAALEARLAPYDSFFGIDWFREAIPLRIPRATDYLRPQLLGVNPVPSLALDPDPKFQILLSPGAIQRNLDEYRRHCDARGTALAVAFVDIDEFKAFNTKYGEPRVDRELLPVYYRVLDRSVFGHGTAYRYGGDEAVLLLPSAPRAVAIAILQHLQAALDLAHYPGIEPRPTISIGVCILDPESALLNREALARAAAAKKRAKAGGRNCIAIAIAPLNSEDVEVLPTKGVLAPT
jgi:diguanylate cyclase (GGDEF)-like protein